MIIVIVVSCTLLCLFYFEDFIICADFFDAGVMPSASVSKDAAEAEETKPSAMADILPEGFFDDPKQDAKVSMYRTTKYMEKLKASSDR